MKYKITLAFLLSTLCGYSQFSDSLKIEVGTNLSTANKNYLPFWLITNKFGVVSDQQFDFSSHFSFKDSYINEELVSPYDLEDNRFYIDYGLDIFNNNHGKNFLIKEGYLKAHFKKLSASIGRFEHRIGEINHDLATGSFGLSGNALPIPKISLEITDYIDVPFTKGFLQFKGHIAHGWMGYDQYMKGAYLHEKTLYGRLGTGRFRLYGGIQHYAIWGGFRPDAFEGQRLNKTFKGFLDVLFVFKANDGSVPENVLPNRPGDHRGSIEAGAEWEDENIKMNLNNEVPFEMGQNLDIKNIDRLLSLNITFKNKNTRLQNITFQFIHTKQMNNFYRLSERENYYNNGVYRTGWEYQDHIIGNNLFINRTRGEKYFDDVHPYDWEAPKAETPALSNIINPRVIGGHMGALYKLSRNSSAKTLITLTKNFGNYLPGHFDGGKSQFYGSQEFRLRLPNRNVLLTGAIAADIGQFSNTIGTTFGINWQFSNQ